jgi:DNA-binding MarR family transcriptional regulator
MVATGDPAPSPAGPPSGPPDRGRSGRPGGPGPAFLLAQIGAHAAGRFAERIAVLDLAPAQAGLLRAVATQPGQSQQTLAHLLGTPASRLVGLVDGLERRGVLERRQNPQDRRLHALYLTEAGAALIRRLGELARVHDRALCHALSAEEREVLRGLLVRIADEQGLTAGVHPGYRALPAPGTP